MKLALLALCLCAAVPASAQQKGSWDKLAGSRSGVAKDAVVTAVARTPAEWEALWQRHTGGDKKRGAPPVDFTKEMVVGVFLGARPRAGYWVELKTVELPSEAVDEALTVSGPSLVVFYKEVKPKTDFGAGLMSAPFELRKVKRYAAVTFEPDTLMRAHGAIDTLRAFKDEPRFDL